MVGLAAALALAIPVGATTVACGTGRQADNKIASRIRIPGKPGRGIRKPGSRSYYGIGPRLGAQTML